LLTISVDQRFLLALRVGCGGRGAHPYHGSGRLLPKLLSRV